MQGRNVARHSHKCVRVQLTSLSLAGLRLGYVITEVNGRKIRSTDDLAAMLAQKGPGIKVNISYLFWSNLGWMPKETVVILGSGD